MIKTIKRKVQKNNKTSLKVNLPISDINVGDEVEITYIVRSKLHKNSTEYKKQQLELEKLKQKGWKSIYNNYTYTKCKGCGLAVKKIVKKCPKCESYNLDYFKGDSYD